ncbi:MAG: DNA recombination protein RmuC [Propionibacteriaceae bacterium]|nr:DNA recombination protein RmuC [Propionibacteriaceae bacterium]
MEILGWILIGLALGVAVGWLVARARADSAAAEVREESARRFEELADAKARAAAAFAERDAARARAEEIAADREELSNRFKVMSAEIVEKQSKASEATAEQRLQATQALLEPVRESLDKFNSRLTEVEKERASMTAELRGQVAEVKLTGEQLRRETNALATALRKPQVRGAWGEMQLKRVAELAGMLEHCDFVEQESSRTSAGDHIRPDMKVMLAGGKFVYVDSKVPLSAFLDAHETDDERERAQKLTVFAKNVTNHIDGLSKKDYFKADTATPEFVVLFLPSEALAAEALTQLPDLFEYAHRKNVVLATPTTLIAMLRTVAYSWKQSALADSAKEVFELGRELYDRLGILGKHFDKVGRSLGTAVTAYNEAVGSIEGRVFPTARKLRDLQVTDKELEPIQQSDAGVRALSAPELVSDAIVVPSIIGRGKQAEPEQEALLG